MYENDNDNNHDDDSREIFVSDHCAEMNKAMQERIQLQRREQLRAQWESKYAAIADQIADALIAAGELPGCHLVDCLVVALNEARRNERRCRQTDWTGWDRVLGRLAGRAV